MEDIEKMADAEYSADNTEAQDMVAKYGSDFNKWPLAELAQFILIVYHRFIRTVGPEIQAMLHDVATDQGEEHPSLFEVEELFDVSMLDLEHHLMKEERVLFPYIFALCEAQERNLPAPQFHCGSIANPIEVMKMEHEAEKTRYSHIEDLTGGYEAPADSDEKYHMVMARLKDFNEMLLQHIHLENDVLFPRSIDLYEQL